MSDVEKLTELTKDIKIAMLTTVDAEGGFTSRPMTQQEVEDDGSLWFFAERESHAVSHLAGNDHVGVTLSSSDVWVSINGTAVVTENVAKKKELWNAVIEAWLPQGAEDPSVVLIKVTADSAEYWDTPGKAATLLSFVKAKATGERYEGGDNEKLEL